MTTAAFAFGTASGSRFVLGGKDFAGMDGGVAGVSVLKGAAEEYSPNLAVWQRYGRASAILRRDLEVSKWVRRALGEVGVHGGSDVCFAVGGL